MNWTLAFVALCLTAVIIATCVFVCWFWYTISDGGPWGLVGTLATLAVAVFFLVAWAGA